MNKWFVSLVLLLIPVATWADAASQLKESLDRISTLEGSFEQVLTDRQGEQLQKSKGSFTLKRPGFFYWKSDAPFEQLVIGTPEKVWVYDPDLEQVTIRKNQQQQDSPAAIISGDLMDLKTQFVITSEQKSGLTTYKLSPLGSAGSYKKVELSFNGQQLVKLSFLDKLEQTTQIEFSKTQQNQPVADSQFNFNVPAGVDVILDD